jgi:hypothetical protein
MYKPNIQLLFDAVAEHHKKVRRAVHDDLDYSVATQERIREETKLKFAEMGIEDCFDWSDDPNYKDPI